MVLDSSAIVAVHLREPGYERLTVQIGNAEILVVGTPTLLETTMVLTARLGQNASPLVQAFLHRFQVEVVPFTQQHLDAAITAFIRYGRGRHPAGLNFGDCLSYAIAKIAGMPLLFIGNDFTRTDIVQQPA